MAEGDEIIAERAESRDNSPRSTAIASSCLIATDHSMDGSSVSTGTSSLSRGPQENDFVQASAQKSFTEATLERDGAVRYSY